MTRYQQRTPGPGGRGSSSLPVGLLCCAALVGCADQAQHVGDHGGGIDLTKCVNSDCSSPPLAPLGEQVESVGCNVPEHQEIEPQWSVLLDELVACGAGECERREAKIALGTEGSLWVATALRSAAGDSNMSGVHLAHHAPDGQLMSSEVLQFEVVDRDTELYTWPQIAVDSAGDPSIVISRHERTTEGLAWSAVVLRLDQDGSLVEQGASLSSLIDAIGFDGADNLYLASSLLTGDTAFARLGHSGELSWVRTLSETKPYWPAVGPNGRVAVRGTVLGESESQDRQVAVGLNSDSSTAFAFDMGPLVGALLNADRIGITAAGELLRGVDAGVPGGPGYRFDRFDSLGDSFRTWNVSFPAGVSVATSSLSEPVENEAGDLLGGSFFTLPDGTQRQGVVRVSEAGDSCDLFIVASVPLQSDDIRVGPDGALYLAGGESYGKLVLPSP